jgi:hypothetical protein
VPKNSTFRNAIRNDAIDPKETKRGRAVFENAAVLVVQNSLPRSNSSNQSSQQSLGINWGSLNIVQKRPSTNKNN